MLFINEPDVTPLRSLTTLEHLFIDSNAVRDLAPRSELTNLQTLAPYDNPSVADISPLRDLKQLT